jgi:hypothetical protein
LERTLADLNKVANESWPAKLLSTLKAELSIPGLATQATMGAAAATAFGVPPEIGAVVGVAAAALKVEIRPSRSPAGLPDHLAPYAYAHYIERGLKG